MSNNIEAESAQPQNEAVSYGNLAVVFFALVLLLGLTWLKQPQLFSLKHTAVLNNADVPKYYAYVQPAEDAIPLVAGANTNDGPSVINEDGTVSNVDMGQVLGVSTQDVNLSLDSLKVSTIPDSQGSVEEYFKKINNVESGPVDNSDFETALSSGNQSLIDAQAEKLFAIQSTLQKMVVPKGMENLHKLKIINYEAAVAILKNFTMADQNPELVGGSLQRFLKSQQDLDRELTRVVKQYKINPYDYNIVLPDISGSDITQDLTLSNVEE